MFSLHKRKKYQKEELFDKNLSLILALLATDTDLEEKQYNGHFPIVQYLIEEGSIAKAQDWSLFAI